MRLPSTPQNPICYFSVQGVDPPPVYRGPNLKDLEQFSEKIKTPN